MIRACLVQWLLAFSIFRQVAPHGYLAKPPSKNAADMQSYKLPFQDYYIRANWWVDKAYLNNDPLNQKPWSAPGHFNYKTAYDIAQQNFHPCGCYNPGRMDFCAGVTLASKFGEVTPGHDASATFPKISPPSWAPGTRQETAFNFYANHAGGYLYMLCKKSTFDQCKTDLLPTPIWTATPEQNAAYLKCVWDCFEANVLEFIPDSQKIQYGDRNDLTVNAKTVTKGPSGVLPKGAVWREAPIPDAHQISSGHHDHGRCTWDAINATSFSNAEAKQKFTASFGDEKNCDGGPDNHVPRNWHIKDMVQVPANLPQGEYVLSWRWECGVADQLWSNCADVNVTSSSGSMPNPEPEPEPQPEPEPAPACNDIVGDVPGALPAAWLPQWLGGDEITCEAIQRLAEGDTFCKRSSVVKKACCFCGGGFTGGPTPEPEPEPEPTPASEPQPMPEPKPTPATAKPEYKHLGITDEFCTQCFSHDWCKAVGHHVCEAYKYASLGVSDAFCSQCTSKGWCKGASEKLCTKLGMAFALEKAELTLKSNTRQKKNKSRFLGSSFIQKMVTMTRNKFPKETVVEI